MTAARRTPTATLARTEAKLFLREPIALFWGVAFPLVLLIVMGATGSDKASSQYGGLRFIDVYVPVLMVFVLTIVAVNALPAVLASYRDKGYLRRLATTPVGPRRLLGVQLGLNLAVCTAAMVLIVLVARIAFDVRLPQDVAGWVVALALTAVAMLGLGGLVAAVSPSQRLAGLIGSLLFFPMMFFAGLWGPRTQMGPGLRHVSDFTPLGASVGAIQDAVAGHWPHWSHLGVLAVYAIVFPLVATRLFRWDK
jgi:ABC-2 type transport system permease protein